MISKIFYSIALLLVEPILLSLPFTVKRSAFLDKILYRAGRIEGF
jgi:hypothetical protein